MKHPTNITDNLSLKMLHHMLKSGNKVIELFSCSFSCSCILFYAADAQDHQLEKWGLNLK